MTTEVLYFNATSFFEALREDIANARESIDIEVYIWSADTVGNEMFELLVAAVNRGIKVRLIVDGVGSFLWIQTQLKPEYLRGVEVHVFNRFNKLWAVGLWPKLNRRTHRKIFLIDRKIFYTGSINIFSEAMQWRESGIKLISDSVDVAQAVFDYTWKWSRFRMFRFFSGKRSHLYQVLKKATHIRTNQYFRLRWSLRRDLIRRIWQAKEKVWFITPYFNPPNRFLAALRNAARRGVDVRLILPRDSDIFFAPWIGQLHYRILLADGVKIYEYGPEILHAKSSIIDDWSTMGSSNLNYRSFQNDFELDVVLSLPSSKEEMAAQFLRDMARSNRIESVSEIAFWKRWLSILFFRVKRRV